MDRHSLDDDVIFSSFYPAPLIPWGKLECHSLSEGHTTLLTQVTKVCRQFTDSLQSLRQNVNLMKHAPTLNPPIDEDAKVSLDRSLLTDERQTGESEPQKLCLRNTTCPPLPSSSKNASRPQERGGEKAAWVEPMANHVIVPNQFYSDGPKFTGL